MKWFCRPRPVVSLVVTLAAVTLSVSAEAPRPAADDWPMFGRTVQRNMVNTTDTGLPTEWSVKEGEQQNVKWVARLGGTSYGGPVVSGGQVYVGTNNEKPRNPKIKGDKGVVMCFREKDGEFLWQAVHDKLPNGMENDWAQQGIASTPAVEGKRVYYVSNRCEVICADAKGFYDGNNDGVQDEEYKGPTDADIVWRLDMMKELNVFPRFLASCSPLIAGDLLFVVTGNGVNDKYEVPSPTAPSFIAVDKRTGKVVWQDNSPGTRIMEGQWSNPVYAEANGKAQVIFPGGDGWLYSFEPTSGKPIWKFDCNPKKSDFKPGKGTRNYFLATPVVHDNKLYIGVGRVPENEGPGVGHLWCVDITKTGDVSPVGDNFDPKAEVNKNSALVWHFGGAAPEGSDREYVFGRTLSTCVVHDGLVYVTDLDGFLYCLDANTGQKYWTEDLKSGVWGSPCWADGNIYIGNEDGDVYVFAHGKEKKQLGKVEMEDPIRGPLVAAHGVLYVMTKSRLFAISKGQGSGVSR